MKYTVTCEKCLYKKDIVDNHCKMSGRDVTKEYDRHCYFHRNGKNKRGISEWGNHVNLSSD